jgi:hypothetical protein
VMRLTWRSRRDPFSAVSFVHAIVSVMLPVLDLDPVPWADGRYIAGALRDPHGRSVFNKHS